MNIESIHHVQLAMPAGCEEAAREFYCGIFGISEVPKPPDLLKRGGVWFENGNVRIHVGVEMEFKPAHKAHPGLIVRDLPSLVQRLREAGYEVLDDDRATDCQRAYVNDPFGNRIELMEPHT